MPVIVRYARCGCYVWPLFWPGFVSEPGPCGNCGKRPTEEATKEEYEAQEGRGPRPIR